MRPGAFNARVELMSGEMDRLRVDVLKFTFDQSPVTPSSWSTLKSLY